MDSRRFKFLALGSGVFLTMAFLIWLGVSGDTGGFAYYVSVSEFLETTSRPTDGYRVNGKVADGTIVRLPTGQDVTFQITDGDASMMVRYHGIVPDTFVDGADVVVEGKMQQDGAFQAHMLLAKCPSKYESADEPGAEPALQTSSMP